MSSRHNPTTLRWCCWSIVLQLQCSGTVMLSTTSPHLIHEADAAVYLLLFTAACWDKQKLVWSLKPRNNYWGQKLWTEQGMDQKRRWGSVAFPCSHLWTNCLYHMKSTQKCFPQKPPAWWVLACKPRSDNHESLVCFLLAGNTGSRAHLGKEGMRG